MVILTREEIYWMVWKMPMTEIAKKYQISDVGFRKLCLRMNIPVPKSGFWTKVKAGHSFRQPSLPLIFKGKREVTLTARRPESAVRTASERHSILKKVTLEKLPFKVPDRINNPDPLIIEARESLWKLTDPQYPGMAVTAKDQLNIRVTPANVGRALRFMDTLIKCVRAKGLVFVIEDNKNYIKIDGIKLAVVFRERTTRVKIKGKSYVSHTWQPTGKIVFRLEGRQRAEWGDLKKRLLEDQLPQILRS